MNISIVRTLTTIVVGFILNLPATPFVLDFLDINGEKATAYLGAGVSAVLAGVYYAIVRALEEHKSEAWGWLLGIAAKPRYQVPATLGDNESEVG